MTTEIVVVIDETGSMADLTDETISSFNGFLRGQRDKVLDGKISLMQFSKTYDEESNRMQYEDKRLNDAPELSRDTYRPRGLTPLLDAVGSTVDRVLARHAVGDKPDLTIMCVITDGMENTSQEYTLAQVKQRIKTAEGLGWKFVFLGANMDAVGVGTGMGMPAAATANYEASKVGTRHAYATMSHMVDSYTDGDNNG